MSAIQKPSLNTTPLSRSPATLREEPSLTERIKRKLSEYFRGDNIAGGFTFLAKVAEGCIQKNNLSELQLAKRTPAAEIYEQGQLITYFDKIIKEILSLNNIHKEMPDLLKCVEEAQVSLIKLKASLAKIKESGPEAFHASDLEVVDKILGRANGSLKELSDLKKMAKKCDLNDLRQRYRKGFFKTISLTYLYNLLVTHIKHTFSGDKETKSLEHRIKELEAVKRLISKFK